MNALDRTHIFSNDQTHKVMDFLVRLADVIGETGLARLKFQQVNRELKESAAIIYSSEDAIIGKTLTGIITSWNPGAETIFGYSASKAVGQSMTILIPKEKEHEESDILSRIAQGEKLDHIETRQIPHDPISISSAQTILEADRPQL